MAEANPLLSETLLSLRQAAARVPSYHGSAARGCNASTVFRWIVDGVRIPGGRLKLEAVRLAGRWLTSVEALNRFLATQDTVCRPEGQEPPDRPVASHLSPRTPEQRKRDSERASRELQKAGI